MKENKLVKNICYLAICLVMAVTIMSYFKMGSSSAQQQPRTDAATVSRLQQGLGSEVEFGKAGTTPTKAETNVEALAGFIEKRSGLQTSTEVKRRLAKLESEAQNGKLAPISLENFTTATMKVLFERVSTLSDKEIDQVVESLRGFNSPDLPEGFVKGRDNLKLRPSYISSVTPQQAKEQLKALRDKNAQTLVTNPFSVLIKREMASELKDLATALPNTFGSNWDTQANQARQGLTPMQSFWLFYSLASGDKGLDNQVALQDSMAGLERAASKVAGAKYPSSAGHTPYGDNGYVYSSPVFLLDETTLIKFLDIMEGR